MSVHLLISIILFVVILLGLFSGRYRAEFANVGSIIAAIAALFLFLMAINVVHF